MQPTNEDFEKAVAEKLAAEAAPASAEEQAAAPEQTEPAIETAETPAEPSPEPAPSEPAAEAENSPVEEAEASGDTIDGIGKEEAIALIKDSTINQGYKKEMLEQIESGKGLARPFSEALGRIRAAKLGGSIYRAGQDGL